MSEEQVGTTRRRRSQAEIEQLVAEFEASGISGGEFCQRHGLAVGTLARYRRRLRQAQGEAAGASRWLAVELSAPSRAGGSGMSSGLALALSGGRRIEIERGFDAPTLRQLLKLLKLLLWDGSGLWVCAKRLEKGRFRWPEAAGGQARIVLSHEELALLVGGIDLAETRRRRWYRNTAFSEAKIA